VVSVRVIVGVIVGAGVPVESGGVDMATEVAVIVATAVIEWSAVVLRSQSPNSRIGCAHAISGGPCEPCS
jgi:hypothetical protein